MGSQYSGSCGLFLLVDKSLGISLMEFCLSKKNAHKRHAQGLCSFQENHCSLSRKCTHRLIHFLLEEACLLQEKKFPGSHMESLLSDRFSPARTNGCTAQLLHDWEECHQFGEAREVFPCHSTPPRNGRTGKVTASYTFPKLALPQPEDNV